MLSFRYPVSHFFVFLDMYFGTTAFWCGERENGFLEFERHGMERKGLGKRSYQNGFASLLSWEHRRAWEFLFRLDFFFFTVRLSALFGLLFHIALEFEISFYVFRHHDAWNVIYFGQGYYCYWELELYSTLTPFLFVCTL